MHFFLVLQIEFVNQLVHVMHSLIVAKLITPPHPTNPMPEVWYKGK